MVKIDIVSGFLGAGKTTLINRLISQAYMGEKLVLIENEFGEIGIDGGFLQNSGIQISEINSGCICCSLVGDFSEALKKVVSEYHPDRILIEPSGVGKLSEVTSAVMSADIDNAVINSAVVVVDVNKCKMYMKNFGEFFNDQIKNAGCIYFSHTDKTTSEKLTEAITLVRTHNQEAELITTPADKLDILDLVNAFERTATLKEQLRQLIEEEACPVCHHHHHHHDDHEDCDCHEHEHEHHHDHDHDECDCHEHKHHHHEHEKCDCHEHEHHHDHDECDCHEHNHHHEHEECDCHKHEHHHHKHGHHHADEVFTSWGTETVKKYTKEQISDILKSIESSEKYGFIIRAKGIVEGVDGQWIHFDYVPEEADIRNGCAATIGKLCVIGANINEQKISQLFEV